LEKTNLRKPNVQKNKPTKKQTYKKTNLQNQTYKKTNLQKHKPTCCLQFPYLDLENGLDRNKCFFNFPSSSNQLVQNTKLPKIMSFLTTNATPELDLIVASP